MTLKVAITGGIGSGKSTFSKHVNKLCFPLCDSDELVKEIDEIKTLPGIGDYTSNVLAALIYNTPTLALDGNVKRVIARYKNISNPIDNNETQKELKSFAEALLPKNSFRVPNP